MDNMDNNMRLFLQFMGKIGAKMDLTNFLLARELSKLVDMLGERTRRQSLSVGGYLKDATRAHGVGLVDCSQAYALYYQMENELERLRVSVDGAASEVHMFGEELKENILSLGAKL
ncbi:uncharacterized protein [Euphorbia lathyris]|uniref:uncharacterized protein n=1 Tax=Euphorbia lathyris TaxID=212925 RepID=UPI003313CC44